MPSVSLEIRFHTGTKIAGHALGDLDFNFESRQIDHRQERRIFRDAGAIRNLHLTDLTGDRTVSAST